MKVTVNRKALLTKLAPPVLRTYQKNALIQVNRLSKKHNQELLKRFLTHEISREISGGVNASNISGTLNGKGNLFTFLGFSEGSSPISEIASFLADCIKVEYVNTNIANRTVSVSIYIPSSKELDTLAKLPWLDRGMVRAIEAGVSGLGNYLYSSKGFSSSRSRKGIQAKSKISSGSGSVPPQSYLSDILKDISKKLASEITKSI